MSFNIYECLKCKRRLIAEEIENHECKSVVKYEIKRSILWVNDGSKWYPLRLKKRSDGFTQGELSDKDFPEPLYRFCKVVVGSYSCKKTSVNF